MPPGQQGWRGLMANRDAWTPISSLPSTRIDANTASFACGFHSLRRVSVVMPSLTGTSSTTRRLQLIILVNFPQVVMVATYLLYNSLLIILVVELEWHAFAKKRKAVRVSTPRGAQRETFYLSLPYRYSIPLAVLSAGLQWLVSQSLFFAEVDLWDETGQRRIADSNTILTLGYSNLRIFWLLFVGILVWLPVVTGW